MTEMSNHSRYWRIEIKSLIDFMSNYKLKRRQPRLRRNSRFPKLAPKSIPRRLRILVSKPGLDGHDRGALILCKAFRDAGMEVIYGGVLTTPEQVALTAIDEDVDVVALSLLNGAHMAAFPRVAKLLRDSSAQDIVLVGGGIIPNEDKLALEKQGITGNFGPGTPLGTIVNHVKDRVANRRRVTTESSQ